VLWLVATGRSAVDRAPDIECALTDSSVHPGRSSSACRRPQHTLGAQGRHGCPSRRTGRTIDRHVTGRTWLSAAAGKGVARRVPTRHCPSHGPATPRKCHWV